MSQAEIWGEPSLRVQLLTWGFEVSPEHPPKEAAKGKGREEGDYQGQSFTNIYSSKRKGSREATAHQGNQHPCKGSSISMLKLPAGSHMQQALGTTGATGPRQREARWTPEDRCCFLLMTQTEVTAVGALKPKQQWLIQKNLSPSIWILTFLK